MEEHLWTPSFFRLASASTDEKKLRVLQKVILHKSGSKLETHHDKPTKTKNLVKNSEQPSRKIKIKAIFPKGSLENTNMESFTVDSTKEIPSKTKNSPPKPHKETKKLRNLPKIMNTVAPVMGKTALLANCKNTKNSDGFSDVDADIITKIVMEKFKNILINYYRRSFIRLISRKKVLEITNEDVNSDNLTNTIIPREGDNNLDLDNKTDSSELPRNDNLNIILSMDDQDLVPQPHFKQEAKNSRSDTERETLNLIQAMGDHQVESQLEEVLARAQNSVRPVLEKLTSLKFEEVEDACSDETLKYDSQKFLSAALGDELYNCSTAGSHFEESQGAASCSSDYEGSSIHTAQISSLMSKSDSLYSVFSRRIRRPGNTHTSSPVSEKTPAESPYGAYPHLDSKASILIHEASVQHQIIVQTSKALNICFSTKEFQSSVEYIEAEKILLLAIQKREVVLKELMKVEYEVENGDSNYLGEVIITNLTFPLEAKVNESVEFSRWFFAIVHCGSVALATEVIVANEDCDIRFLKTFKFEELDSAFEIVVNIYSLQVKSNIKYDDHELKFHLKKQTTMCPSPNKFIGFRKSPNKYRRHYSYERRHPSFVLWGSTTIRITDLTKPVPLKLSQIPSCSTLKGTMTVDLSSCVEITGTYSGFLTIGSEAGGFASWSRRWCQLTGHKLQYWNYPTEQELTEPIGSIDLSYCVVSCISQVDRELCARPRTLLLETGRLSAPNDRNSLMVLCKSSYTIVRHYLSADNSEEMTTWQKKLNSIISALRNWNCMKCQIYFKD